MTGEEFIKTLLDDFLFAASKVVQLHQTVANTVILQSGVRLVDVYFNSIKLINALKI